MLFITLLAMPCGAKYCTEIAVFGRAKEGLLRTVLVPKNDAASHTTSEVHISKLFISTALDNGARSGSSTNGLFAQTHS
jgi:hypothetical protein